MKATLWVALIMKQIEAINCANETQTMGNVSNQWHGSNTKAVNASLAAVVKLKNNFSL